MPGEKRCKAQPHRISADSVHPGLSHSDGASGDTTDAASPFRESRQVRLPHLTEIGSLRDDAFDLDTLPGLAGAA